MHSDRERREEERKNRVMPLSSFLFVLPGFLLRPTGHKTKKKYTPTCTPLDSKKKNDRNAYNELLALLFYLPFANLKNLRFCKSTHKG